MPLPNIPISHKLVVTFWLLMLSASAASAQQQAPFVLSLVVSISTPDGERELAMDRYPRFYVQFINISEQPQRIWKDWNSWGWFNLSLRMQSEQGVRTISRKRPAAWDGDFPDFWTVPPGESIIMEVDMTSGEWQGLPDLYGERLPARLTAHLRKQIGYFGARIQDMEWSPKVQ